VKKTITSDQWKLAPPRNVPAVHAGGFPAGMMASVDAVPRDSVAI
jgi:hypothetical protein